MDKDITALEVELLDVASELLSHQGQQFKDLGLTPKLAIDRSGHGDRYSSELQIYFWSGQTVADAIEFHVFRRGEPAVTVGEASQWLEKALQDVLSRRNKRGST